MRDAGPSRTIGITDLSDALGLADFALEGKRIILLMRRGQVYEALGVLPQAANDFPSGVDDFSARRSRAISIKAAGRKPLIRDVQM